MSQIANTSLMNTSASDAADCAMQDCMARVADYEPHECRITNLPMDLGVLIIVCGVMLMVLLGFRRCHRLLRFGSNKHSDDRVGIRRDIEARVQQISFSRAARRWEKKKHRTETSDMLRQHAKSGELQEMTQLLEELEQSDSSCLCIQDYRCVIVHLARAGDPSTAHKWLRRSIEVGLPPKPGTFKTLMGAYAEAGAITQALQVASEMEFEGMAPDDDTYNNIQAWRLDCNAAKAACNTEEHDGSHSEEHSGNTSGEREDAASLLTRGNSANGQQPARIMWSSILRQHANLGRLQEMTQTLEAIEQQFPQCLDIRDYRCVVLRLVSAGDASTAHRWLRRSIAVGLLPKPGMCTAVMDAYAATGDLTQALELAGEMELVGMRFHANRCNIIEEWRRACAGVQVGLHAKEHVFSFRCEREELAASMARTVLANAAQWKPEEEESHKMRLRAKLRNYAKYGRLEKMLQTIEEIENAYGSCHDIGDYGCVIVQLAQAGHPGAAQRWLWRSFEVGLHPKAEMFNLVISSYVEAGAIEQVMQVAVLMDSAGVEFDTGTYNAIMDAWSRTGDTASVQLWMKKMLGQGVQPDIATFGIVLFTCASAGLVEDLELWYAVSKKFNTQLDGTVFDPVVQAFVQINDLANARKWLTLMIENGVQPSHTSFMGVLASIYSTGDVWHAASFIHQLHAAGQQLGSGLVDRCIESAAWHGHGSEALQLAHECASGMGTPSYTITPGRMQG